MRYLVALLVFPAFAFNLSSGTYTAYEFNNDSVCPQKIRVIQEDENIYLKVAYVGDCFYQGPYIYYCFDDICSDGQIEYYISGKDAFTWINKSYQLWGKFKRQ